MESNHKFVEDEVLQKRIRQLILAGSSKCKLSDVVNSLELVMNCESDEDFRIEKIYIETVLKCWLEESCENALNYLKNTNDISVEMPILLNQLDSIQLLRDVRKLEKGSQVLKWCTGDRFKLIVHQSDVFETTRVSINMVSNYLNKFKQKCIYKIISLCLNDREHATDHRIFIKALKTFLDFVNDDVRRTTILSDDFLNNQLNAYSGEELIEKLVELCHHQYYSKSISQAPDQVTNFLEAADKLLAKKKTLKLASLTKEICKRLLLPKTTVEYKTEGGRRLIVIEGVVVFISKIKDEMIRLNNKHDIEEVQIVGLSSVHIDCNLEQEVWHGTNVSVATYKLFVDTETCWDLSGRNSGIQLGTAISGQTSGGDGQAGEHGEPGESGGNVYVVCRKIFNAHLWTIKSDGGRGSDGQNGGHGKDGMDSNDGQPRNWASEEEFQRFFPSMSKSKSKLRTLFFKPQSAMKVVLKTLDNILERDRCRYGKDIGPKHRFGDFFIEGPWKNVDVMTTVSFYDASNERHTLILSKGVGWMPEPGGRGGEGGRGGQGGYRGNIVIQNMGNGEPLETCDSMGEENHPTATAVIVQSNRDGPDGVQGVDGMGGQYGAFKSLDVGFMDCADRNFKPIYFGFDDDKELTVNYYENTPSEPYVKCKIPDREEVLYAKIEAMAGNNQTRIRQTAKTTFGRQNQVQREAVRKKAITRQSLDQHVANIAKRKQMIQTIKTIISQTVEQLVGDDETINDLTIYSTASTHQDQQGDEQIYSRASLKNLSSKRVPAITNYSTNHFRIVESRHNMQGIDKHISCADFSYCSLCQIDFEDTAVVRLNPQFFIRFLKPQNTVKGKDSILHAALGSRNEKSSPYSTNGAEQMRRKVAKALPKEIPEHVKTYDYKTQLVLRIKNNDKHFQLASRKKTEFFQFQDSRLWERVKSVREDLKKEVKKPENKELMTLLQQHYNGTPIMDDKLVDLVLTQCLTDQGPITAKIWEKALNKCGRKLKSVLESARTLEEKFEWDGFPSMNSPDKWTDEYYRFIDLESLGWIESELLSDRAYHLYYIDTQESNDEDCLGQIEYAYTLNSEKIDQRFVLYEGKGVWTRLEISPKFKTFYEERARQALIFRRQHCNQEQRPKTDEDIQQNINHWFEIKKSDNLQQIITSIQMIGSKTDEASEPLELLKFIWKWLNHSNTENHQHQCEGNGSEIISLAERVVDYNSRTIDPIFYLHTLANFCPPNWKYEFLLQDMEERMFKVLQPRERNQWRKTLCKLSDGIVSTLSEKLQSTSFVSVVEEDVSNFEEILRKIMELLENDLEINEADISHLYCLPLHDWHFDLKIKHWEKKVKYLATSIGERERLEAVYLLLEIENKKGEPFCQSLIAAAAAAPLFDIKLLRKEFYGDLTLPRSELRETRTYEEIIKTIDEDANTSKEIVSKQPTVKTEVKMSFNIPQRILEMKNVDWPGKFETLNDIKLWAECYVKNLNNQAISELKQLPNGRQIETAVHQLTAAEFLFIYDRAVELVFPIKEDESKYHLRDTQRVTIVTLIINEASVLAQVSTGEGKSLIVAGVAIYRALNGQKVDVITSNNVLAIRDSTLSVIDGGLCDLYAAFGVSVANNCSQVTDERIKAYDSAVVYGELSNFQRDYLLHDFYEQNIRGDRTFDCVIIDEVDCMLLDRGNNMLYLSHDIPGMEMLESLYVFIWQKICTSTDSLDQIKSAVLYDLYGTITQKDLMSIRKELKPKEVNALWVHLIEKQVIDETGRLLVEDANTIPDMIDNNCIDVKNLSVKLVYFFRLVIERDRRIRIPQHLLSFVNRHLDSWLDNAWRALNELKLDTDYVVSQDRTGVSLDVSPQVIIIDHDTGTDQVSSQWDKALHQFLQLKEGCQITLQSLKSIFISNVSYIKRYKRLFGVSGTLGSKIEREFLQQTYECNYFTVPTAFPKDFHIWPGKVLKTKESWLEAITEETRRTVIIPSSSENDEEIAARPRSILIFCGSINDTKVVHKHLRDVFKTELSNEKIHRYVRDYQKFAFESSKLDVGHVIVATNLAGRGTDIKLTEKLRENGGLHICLTYLPENERIEEQAMGRAGRQGNPGSGIVILYHSPTDSSYPTEERILGEGNECSNDIIYKLKVKRNILESQRLSRLRQEFIGKLCKQEKCFLAFSKHYAELRHQMINRQCDDFMLKVVSESALDQWALWLDSIDSSCESFESLSEENLLRKLNDELVLEQRLGENKTDLIKWMTPARSVALAKYLATHKTTRRLFFLNPHNDDENLSHLSILQAIDLLKHVIKSQESFFYPAAYYYRAFTLMKDEGQFPKNNKAQFIQTLQTVDTILSQHIELQTSFSRVINQTLLTTSNLENSNYMRQKSNNIKILEHFLDSVRSLLGTHHCTAEDLQRETGIDDEKADAFINQLIIENCVTCKVNDVETVPKGVVAIQRIAKNFGVSQTSLNKFLLNIKENVIKSLNGLSEKEIEEALYKTDMIRCTREKFWRTLVNAEALQGLPQMLSHQRKQHGQQETSVAELIEDGTDCVIVLESDRSKCPLNQLKDSKRIKIDFRSSSSYFKPIMFSPTYFDDKELEDQKKLVFSRSYVKDVLNNTEYCRMVKTFEFNKIGCLNLDKLQNLINSNKAFGQHLVKNDLGLIQINEADWDGIWEALIKQEVIDSEGYLSLNYDGKEFSFPECSLYDTAIMSLIRNFFAAELVQRNWLKAKEDPEHLKSIIALPLEPYRDMLSDLHAAHIITGLLVRDDKNVDELKKSVKIASKNYRLSAETSKDTRNRIVSFLKSRQAVYAAYEKPEASLVSIERIFSDAIKDGTNIMTEVHVFCLSGFDRVIEVSEKKWQSKMIFRSIIILAIGLVQLLVASIVLFVGAAVSKFLPSIKFLKEGIADIAFAIEKLEAGNNFSWTDYLFHKNKSIRNTLGVGDDLYNRGMDFIRKHIFKKHIKADAIEPAVTPKILKTCKARMKTGMSMELGLTYQRIESTLYRELSFLCSQLEKDLLDETRRIVDNQTTFKTSQKAIDNDKTCILEEKKTPVTERIKKITNGWIKAGEVYISRGLMAIIAKQLTEILSNQQEVTANNVSNIASAFPINEVISVIKSILVSQKVISKLKTTLEEKMIGSFDRNDWNYISELKSQLEDAVGKLMKFLIVQLMKQSTRHITAMTARSISRIYQEGGHEGYKWRDLLQEEQKVRANEVPTTSSHSVMKTFSADSHITSCLKLLKETRDPLLFVAFLREKVAVPADPFCAHALCCTIPTILRDKLKVNISNVFIRIESFDEVLFDNETPTNCSKTVFVVKVHKTTRNDSKSLFYVSKEDDCEGIVCMLQSVAQQIKKVYPQMAKYENEFGKMVADTVEADSLIAATIRNGWHSHTLRIGLFGMGREKNFQRTKKIANMTGSTASSNGVSQKAVYQHPGYVCIEEHAKDKGIRKIIRSDHPVIKIPHHHQQKDKKKIFDADEKPWLEMFENIQRGYLERGEYKSAIWHSIEHYLIPIIAQEEAIDKRESYVSAVIDHFEAYSKLKWIGCPEKTVITKDECFEMKKRLICCTPKLKVSQQFWNQTYDAMYS